jgi:MarR family transcriptional regulator, organic hydroperoxide resistance regulator
LGAGIAPLMRMASRSRRRASDLGDVIELMRLFWAIEHLLRRTSKLLYRRTGITGPQRLVLRVVGQRSGISASELVHAVHLHKSTLTGILKRLERRRLVVREPDPADRRRMCLRPRGNVRALMPREVPTLEAAIRRVLPGLSPAQKRSTRHVLALLVDALEEQVSR